MATNGAPISVDEANQHIDLHLEHYFAPGNYPVKSFTFSAEMLRNYLNAHLSIENVKFMLAASPDDGGNVTPTMIIVGYDTEGNYIKTADGMVLDHVGTCPYNCPTIGPAKNDHIS